MKLLDKNIKLFIFDLDGTLIDSTSLWHDIDLKFFEMHNQELPANYSEEIAHLGLYGTAKYTKEKYGLSESIEEILKIWNDMALKAYQEEIPLKPYALELLTLLKEHNVHIALATANSEDLYLPCIERLGIKLYFDYIIDVTKCRSGKNSSEIYEKTAKYFLLDKEETVVLEDILQSMITAYEAGFNVIGVYDKNSVKDKETNKKYCQLYIDDFYSLIKLIKENN